jgi:hypothetical protein
MGKYKYLSSLQLKILDDLFNSELDEQAVLEKHRVRRSTYERWLEDEVFSERLAQYINGMRRRSDILMAKYRCLAAAKLVELTTSEKPETSRRACLDIISAPNAAEGAEKNLKESDKKIEKISDETASRLLAVMAEEKI